MTESEARQLLARLKAAFPRQVLEQPTVDLYLEKLGAWAFEPARQAVDLVIVEAKGFPSLGALRETYRLLAAREAEERERRERLQEWDQLSHGPRPPVDEILKRLPTAGREFVEAVRGGSNLDLEIAASGACDDCASDGRRYVYGTFLVCGECGAKRLRARERAA